MTRTVRMRLAAEGPGLERVLGAVRFRQMEIASLSATRSGDALEVELEVRARPGRSLPDLASLFARIGEVRSVDIREVSRENPF